MAKSLLSRLLASPLDIKQEYFGKVTKPVPITENSQDSSVGEYAIQYKDRNEVERLFVRMNEYPLDAARYDKPDLTYFPFVRLVFIAITFRPPSVNAPQSLAKNDSEQFCQFIDTDT